MLLVGGKRLERYEDCVMCYCPADQTVLEDWRLSRLLKQPDAPRRTPWR